MHKKAQAAMEFLMTYGWAILVVLVAIGALAYFGVLNPDKMLPEKCIISSGSGLFCDKFSISSTQIDLKIKNSLADQVTVTALSVSDSGCGAIASSVIIAADGSNTTTLTGCSMSEKINGDISITFSDPDGFSKTSSGTLVARVP